MEGVCGSKIERLAVHATHSVLLARKLQMHRVVSVHRCRSARLRVHKESACGKFRRRSTRGLREGSRPPASLPVANAAPLLGWLPATPAAMAASTAQRLPAAAATRGSARSSAAAASYPFVCAKSSGVKAPCSRGEGRGADRRAAEPPLRAPHPALRHRVHPWGCEEEGDDVDMIIASCPMQRGSANLQGRGRRGREEGGGEVRGDAGGRGAHGRRGGGRQTSARGHTGASSTNGCRCGLPQPVPIRGDFRPSHSPPKRSQHSHQHQAPGHTHASGGSY